MSDNAGLTESKHNDAFMIRKALFIVIFAMMYTIATPVVAMMALSAGMSGFEPGQRAASPAAIWILGHLADFLLFPLIPLFAPRGAPGLWGYTFIFGNGVMWGAVLVLVWSILRRRGVTRSVPSAGTA